MYLETIDKDAQIRALEHTLQAQARLIDQLTSRSILGFFQRRRVRKMREVGELVRYLREDALRAENIELKSKLRGS